MAARVFWVLFTAVVLTPLFVFVRLVALLFADDTLRDAAADFRGMWRVATGRG